MLLIVCGACLLPVTSATAPADILLPAQGSQTVELTGGWGAVGPTTSGFYDDGTNFSYPVILDTGSSGNVMSWTVRSSFGVPLTSGESYTDVGIGGNETFDVTDPIKAYFAPTTTDPDSAASFSEYGTYKFQARRESLLEDLGIFFDIIGTPVIKQKVMHVTPGNETDLISQGGVTNLAETHLLSSVPQDLGNHAVYRIPFEFQNFVSGTPAPSVEENPIVHDVVARAGSNTTGATGDWLFDSGGSVSIVTETLAGQIGIDTSEAPLFTIQVFGVGDQIVDFDAYQLTDLSLPMTDGQRLIFDAPIVFIPQVNNLPADLPGILGMNLFNKSFDTTDQIGMPQDVMESLFSEWYFDSVNQQIVLVDANAVPEPATLALPALMLAGAMLRRRRVAA
jgi:hypothetical protein